MTLDARDARRQETGSCTAFGTMDERSSKRARQQRDGGGSGLPANGFGANFPRTSLAGFHLSVETSQKHLFIGVPIELNVSLLNDEDVVQHITQDIHVSITGEDGKVWIAAAMA